MVNYIQKYAWLDKYTYFFFLVTIGGILIQSRYAVYLGIIMYSMILFYFQLALATLYTEWIRGDFYD